MSGTIENWWESFAAKWAPRIPFMQELADKTERSIAGGHVTLMASISMIPVAVAYLTGIKWLCIASMLTFYLIYNAEKPPVGRRIDWITRTTGWLIGNIFAMLALILK